MKILEIGKAIVDIINASDNIGASIKNKIFPLVVDQGTDFPFVTYRRSGILQQDDKDNIDSDSAYMELVIASDKYSDSLELSNQIADELVVKKGNFNGITIDKIKVADSFEDYIEGSYVQYLKIKIEIE